MNLSFCKNKNNSCDFIFDTSNDDTKKNNL